MNKPIARIVCVAVFAGVGVSAAAADNTVLKNDAQKNGYSIGYDIGRSLKRQLEGVDAESMALGLKDAMSSATPALPETEMKQRFVAMQQESARKIPEKNKKEGEAFLAKNKGAKGVKTTASGLQYKVLTAGTGKKPGPEDTVTVNYRGTLIDGTEFDSSYKRGQPATFPVKGVIPGWTEALQLMATGSKWILYIPSGLAYGDRGAGPIIGPNTTLIFEVELLSIAKPSS